MGETGRPKIPFDWEMFDKLCSLGLNKSDICDLMKVSDSTVTRRVQEEHQLNFEQYKDKKMSVIRQKLVQKAYDMALSGDKTLLIFCLKNICGWSDNPRDLKDLKESVDRLVIRYGEDKVV